MPVPTVNLTFHGIGEPVRELAAAEERVWLDRERFASILEPLAGRPNVHITFDDGNASDVEHALPVLRRLGLRATFFVVAMRLGRPGFLDAAGVRTLAAAGMGVGCHGMRHRPWRGLDATALHEELVDARRMLEAATGTPVVEAACPFGAYDRRVLRALRVGGYARVFTSDGGPARAGDWLQPRTTIGAGATPHGIERVLSGETPAGDAAVRWAKQRIKRWR